MRALRLDQLPQLCDELRQDIVEELSVNPGHLASSLGAVELTVALHYVFETPDDRLVWDVGHQAYGHKILTGRRDRFCTNRKLGGLKPFPFPSESEYDTFCCGHASNSISAALGMAVAAKMQGRERKVVAIIGDGAMSGGLAFEGLNNASATPNDMLIILNDNNMSIDKSVGGMKQYLLDITTNHYYNRLRYKLSLKLLEWGVLTENRKRGLIRFGNSLKSLLTRQRNIFEGLDIRYFGIADGHNVVELVKILRRIKDMKGPKLLHIHTVKGKGYAPAEENATVWHAPGKFDVELGVRSEELGVKNAGNAGNAGNDGNAVPMKFQDVFGHTLLELAQRNPRIVGVTPAMPTGCSMNIMMKAMPDRTFDVGIAEGHAVTFSGGMAKDGLLPFCNIYSSFMQRAYDNLIHDAAIMNLDMVVCLDRAGLVGEDGPTHHGAFDLAYLRPIPNLTICSPMDECELRRMMYTAQLPGKGVFVIRYPRGRGSVKDWRCPLEEVAIGKGRLIGSKEQGTGSRETADVAILSLGPIGVEVEKAIIIARMKAENEKRELSVVHYDMRFLKPLDEEIMKAVSTCRRIITVEDGVKNGGLGSAVAEWMSASRTEKTNCPEIIRLGLPDEFVEHGTVAELRKITGIDAESIAKTILS